MELRSRLARWSLARPHVLLVAPLAEPRWDVGGELTRRGWPAAATPADADVVLTVGECGAEMSDAADRLWNQVPRPRHRAHLDRPDDIGPVLDQAASALLTPAAWTPGPRHDHAGAGEASADSGGHDMGGDVAGLPMAGTAPDRDGLELDALTVRLGPVLPGWPTGLLITATLQGDVMTDVRPSVMGPAPTGPVSHAHLHPTMHALDALERLLVVAGWTAAARDAALLRSDLWQAGRSTQDLTRRGRGLARGVTRSRTLAWALRDLNGALPRVRGWCDAIGNGLAGTTAVPSVLERVPIAELTARLDGLDVGSARLVVASMPLDLVPSHDARR